MSLDTSSNQETEKTLGETLAKVLPGCRVVSANEGTVEGTKYLFLSFVRPSPGGEFQLLLPSECVISVALNKPEDELGKQPDSDSELEFGKQSEQEDVESSEETEKSRGSLNLALERILSASAIAEISDEESSDSDSDSDCDSDSCVLTYCDY